MNPLLKRLAALRWKVRLVDGWLGVCVLVSLLLGVSVAIGAIDCAIHLPNLVRAVALVALLVGSGVVVWLYLIKPFAQPCDDLNLALRVEDAYPELNDSLASAVQFLSQSKEDQTRVGGSDAMREKTMQDAVNQAAQFDFNRILDRRGAMIFGVSAFVMIALSAGVVWAANTYRPGYASIAFWRFVEPFGPHTWTRISVARNHPHDEEPWKDIDHRKADSIAVGQPYHIRIDLQGQMPKNKQVKLEIVNTENKIRADKSLEVKIDPETRTASVTTAIDMTQHYTKFKFRITANDGSFPPRVGGWQLVNVKLPPKLDLLDGTPSPHIQVTPPLYSDLPARKELPGTRHLEVYEGTEVFLRAKADRPLVQAWLEYQPENKLIAPAAILSLLSTQNPLNVIAGAMANDAILHNTAATLEQDKSIFHIRFNPSGVGKYVLHMRDADRLYGASDIDVNVLRDPLPDVKLLNPISAVNAHPDAKVAFKFRVKDETFAVRNVFVEYRYRGPDGNPLPAVHRIMLYEGKDYGKLLPSILAKMGRSPLVGPIHRLRPDDLGVGAEQTLRLRPKDLDFETSWSLNNQFKVGDNLIVEVCAEDFCDISPNRQPGRSGQIELRIVSKPDLVKQSREKLQGVQDKLKAIEKEEKKALEVINDIKKLDKLTQDDKDRLVDAEQTQREVQEKIGKTSDQGLRRDLKELLQELRDNELKNTEVHDQASKTKGTLDHIAQGELAQIEPKLAEVRNEATQKDKNSPEMKEKLGEIAKEQKSVLDAIKDLNKSLEPSMRVQQAREELQKIRDKQEKLNNDLKDLKEFLQQQKDDKNLDKEALEKTFKEEVNKNAKEQRELAQQLEKTLKEMKDTRDQLKQEGDQKNAQKIDEAIDKAEGRPDKKQANDKTNPMKMPDPNKQPLNQEMKNIAQQLDNKAEAPQTALDKGKEVLKELDKALEKLDDPNRDNLKQDIADRKEAQKEIDKLRNEIKEMQKQANAIEKEMNEEERLKKKEQLAKQMEGLQEKMEKMERQLAQLQEQKAADDVQKAQEQVAKASKKLQQPGGDMGEMPKDVGEKLKEADNKLRDAKEDLHEAEEELAREALIKLHEKLKFTKERQDAQIERSENLHSKIIQRKSWTNPFLDTIEGNIDAQKMIADETENLREKIKEAKVFEGIMKEAKKSMDTAGTKMENRRDLGKERRYFEEGKGQVFDMEELNDENEVQADIVKNQKAASKRLDRLLDALKQELDKPRPKPKDKGGEKEPGDEPKEQPKQANLPPQDGIPPMAQIKALRAEQLDLNERTEDFDKANPNRNELTERQKTDLNDLLMEQERLRDLFAELVAQRQPNLAEPKEGENKK